MPALSLTQRSTVNLRHKRLVSSTCEPRSRLTVSSSKRRFANEFTVNSRNAYHYRLNAIYLLGTRSSGILLYFLPEMGIQCGGCGNRRAYAGTGGCVRTRLVDIDAHALDQP